jgi:hypothetical protein
MNKRKAEKNHAFFSVQKLENITNFVQSAKVTKKTKKQRRKPNPPPPPPSNKSVLFTPKNSTPP